MPAASNPPLTIQPSQTRPPKNSQPWYSRARLGEWIESGTVQRVIIAVIILNAAVLGVQTAPGLSETAAVWLHRIDQICLAIFVAELGIKFYAFRAQFFRSAWNVFDFVVVAVALVPGSGFAVLRALRVLRVLRLISVVPALRRVVEALVRAVPGILSIGALLGLLFYVAAVMATTLFGARFPEYFGTLGASLVTLFQTMTMDNWSTISREMAPVYPWVWAFFVPFILLSAFTVLNLFVAVMVDAMKFMATEAVPGKADDDGHPGNEPAPGDGGRPGSQGSPDDDGRQVDDDDRYPADADGTRSHAHSGPPGVARPHAHPGTRREAQPHAAGSESGIAHGNGLPAENHQDLLAEVRALRAELAETRQS